MNSTKECPVARPGIERLRKIDLNTQRDNTPINDRNSTKEPNPESKIARVMAAFAAGLTYNRFEAENILHDHCLHSTVSKIQRVYGISIYREFETVRGYQGHLTKVCRYSMLPQEREKASRILRHE